MKENLTHGILRTIAQVMLLVGALGSVGLVLNKGRHTPVFLLILFVGWVLSPFIGLLIVNKISRRWAVLTRVTLYYLILVMVLGSLVSYSGTFSLPNTKPAFIFLIVPLISWLLIVTVILITRKQLRKNSGTNQI